MHQASPTQSLWIRGFITWLVYSLTGVLALSLASDQDQVAPLYLSAGFGVAFVLGWGQAMALAVGLGSATVLVVARWHAPSLIGWGPFIAVALVNMGGGALQAWAGARWASRAGSPEVPLEHPLDIGCFLLLAGPVACLINASVTVPALVASGMLSPHHGIQAGLSWWAGDTLGVLIGTPMMLTLVGQPADLWRARRWIVGIPLLVTTLVLGLTIEQVQRWESQRAQAVFDHDVDSVAGAVNLRLNGYLNALESLHGLYVASADVTRQEFQLASTYWLTTLTGIQAMGWSERVEHSQIPAFEAQQRTEGLPDYRVHDTRAQLAPTGHEVAAIRFVEPLPSNEKALGYNSLSSPGARDAFEQSRRENRPAVSRGLQLAQESDQQTGVVLYRVIYRGQPFTPQARVQATRGAVFLALRMDDMLQAMTVGMPPYLSACLIDATQKPPTLLGGDPLCTSLHGPHPHYLKAVPLEFAGRQWQLVTWTHGPIPVVAGLAWSWLLAAGGVALAASLGALLLVITGHTRRVEASRDVARSQKASAEAANRAKSEFLSRMSHELRTPLNAVLGFAQVMDMDKQSPLTPSQSQRLQQIQHAGWHLLDMIDDVLDLSRIDSGTLKLNTEVVPLPETVLAAMNMVRELAQKQKVTLLDPAPGPAGWGVQADPLRLRQILINLLSNAIKYNRVGGTVKVSMAMVPPSADDPQDRLQLRVEDTGIGMTAEQLTQLFQPFNRLGRERVAPDGAGIGLVISQHLVQLMDGQITVSSQENKGSVFTLTLQAIRLPSPQISTPSVPAPKSVITKANQPVRHVLYVEDNHVNSEVVRGALASRTWIKLTVAPTIEEGLAVLHDRLSGPAPDLVLLDVHLPDASGLEFLRLMKANPQTAATPVIMVSADAMPEQVDAALQAGAYCYMTKPVQLPALLLHVDDLLATHT